MREYALHRALQLDPKNVSAWVALARVYIDVGAGYFKLTFARGIIRAWQACMTSIP